MNLIRTLVPGAGSIEAAARQLQMLGIARQELDAAVAQYEEEVQKIRSLTIVGGLDDPGLPAPWYTGPADNHVFWPSVRKVLLDGGGLSSAAVGMIDRASTAVICRLPPPGSPELSSRGLVVGYVQSGKTTNFTAVIAKAADVGYRLIVVLSGVTDNLRTQTQLRLLEQLIEPRRMNWFALTEDEDFKSPGNAAHLLGDPERRLIGVVKKNPSRLRRLNEWLDSAPDEVMRDVPILVIDDEADQASVDVGEEQRSGINQLILDLLDRPKAAYIGYTATPFANLLADASFPPGLYPRDFIRNLDMPNGYFGTEKIFGRERLTHEEEDHESDGLDVIRHVPDDEIPQLRPPTRRDQRAAWQPSITSSLDSAIRYFLLASAARRERNRGNPHSTMLIHTTQLTEPQMQFQRPIKDLLDKVAARLEREDTDLIHQLRAQWEEEQARVPPAEMGEAPVPFERVLAQLPPVLEQVEVVVDNYRSTSRLDYRGRPRTVIAIGGNTLSRGLTLEGLVVSFFVRSVSVYDTLLQMGRWFGFRQGYADLPRIWMTPELQEWFIHLATVEQEIRHEIERYEDENLSPAEVPVRIRTHPKMNVTSAAKMRHAVAAQMSFSGRRVQTILFNHRDHPWLQQNIDATRELLRRATAAGQLPQDLEHGRWLLEGVPVDLVLEFISRYNFHPNSHDLQADLIRRYIEEQNRNGELRAWNVVILGKAPGAARGMFDPGIGRPVGLINRSRMNIPGLGYANIKALMSKVDMVADLGVDTSSAERKSSKELMDMRPEGVGLLLLYPVDRDSQPAEGGVRTALDAVEHVIGVGLVFPRARYSTPQNYVSADLSGEVWEESEVVDLEQLDPAVDAPGGAG
ncbi:MAG TPA: Z1 domain-containing protein [Longimicrobiaceae bacterium]|nr:Z1 domain-containing protein [Longimicrobiaceae bacterium]